MRPDMMHTWSSDGEFFEDEDALARQLAVRIDSGEDRVMFNRDGCWFRLSYTDVESPPTMTPPVDSYLRNRTYTVDLVTNSPACTGGNVFTSTWPDGYSHEPVHVVARDASSDAPATVEGTVHDVARVLTSIGIVLWPEHYKV